jgi:hypothetical protein
MYGGEPPGILGLEKEAEHRFGKYPTRRRRFAARAVSVAGVFAILVLASPWLLFNPIFAGYQPMWPAGSSTQTMVGSTSYNGINVPNCALVSVSWTNLAGRAVGIGAWQGGEAVLISSCPDVRIPLAPATPPSACPPTICIPGAIRLGPGPMFYQTGISGSFQFVQTQPGGFGLWANAEGTNLTSQDPISVHYSYSVPVFSLGEAPPGTAPTFSPFEWIFFIPVVVAGWVISLWVLKRQGDAPRSGNV